jgi:hypothetical protein
MGSDSSRTDIRYYPSDRHTYFRISGAHSSAEIAPILQQMLESPDYLGVAFSCHRYGPDKSHLSCLIVKRDDVFEARFESTDSTLTLSLTIRPPANLDKSYKPDYQFFDLLNQKMLQILTQKFGTESVRTGS